MHMALMFALSALLIVSAIGILLRSSLHDSLQKQMHNELLFRESLMSPWIIARTSAEGWSTLANKFTVLASVKYCAKVDQGIGELWCKSAPP
ncbi:Signal transduction histidine kinase [Yersinia enterocolitica subsp. palearctica 105.5R(r)]|uniref:Uncharacterized protein n=1 Tax=Yersinia enterocolitica W22703 TaxID=913028 RepID=F4N448_YEREN|nr:Signal transduction histidine kinase [Yersinia enterocolitica subsp. palearctica 105.5R(r)]AJJ26570.1 putative two-component system sensor domain protein [Yersinia enterocolitica]CBX72856.1 unknown protein [Yersinia enterocolitica W22703]KGA67555.1 putative two-component system sensor domain protein [Yersinia enterocolitica]KGA72255.1 putative two-component system sensor domain protein [Yersinia enterocolitica]